MTCIACGLKAHATATINDVVASFCDRHIPFGRAKIISFVTVGY